MKKVKKHEIIEELTKKYKPEFKGMNEKQKKLLAYRKIIELKKDYKSVQELLKMMENNPMAALMLREDLNNKDKIIAIAKASDNSIKPSEAKILYNVYNTGEEYKKIYNSSLISYSKILENYKLLAQELNINSALDLSHLLTYMLWNGYYSVSKKHIYSLQKRLLLIGMHSFDVIKGHGVCLAYAELLHNYLTICEKKSSIINCKVPETKKNISRDYYPNIERNIKSNIPSNILNKILMPFSNLIESKVGNHVITLIEENNKLFIYDPTNLYVFNIVDENTASIITGNGNYYIKLFSTLMFNPNPDPNQLFETLLSNNVYPAFDKNEIIFSFENILELINNNISLMDDAYDNIHKELEVIDKQTNEIGENRKVLKLIKKTEKQKYRL